MAPPSKWLNSDVTLHVGTMTEIKAHIPSFDRRPFALTPTVETRVRENGRLDTIVRLPIGEDADCVPVGLVSKGYALLQHSAVFDEAMNALEEADIDPASVDAELRLTELGERMKITLRLPDNYLFDPGDKFPMTVRLECLNSVDGSTRFRAVMGWFRLVCSNGLAIGITRSESDRRHVGDLQLEHISDVLRTGINEYRLERDTLIRWRDADVSEDDLHIWVENELKTCWGFKAASRTWHIARSGCDVDVFGPYKGHSPTTVPVEQLKAVPGSPEESTSLFDVSQILAWLAKERNDIQQQMEWREQIPTRMLNVTSSCTPARSTVSYCPLSIEIMRLPSHDMPDGLPPKLHGHDTLQLQLSATVAVMCQFGACARDGTTRTSRLRAVRKERMRMGAIMLIRHP